MRRVCRQPTDRKIKSVTCNACRTAVRTNIRRTCFPRLCNTSTHVFPSLSLISVVTARVANHRGREERRVRHVRVLFRKRVACSRKSHRCLTVLINIPCAITWKSVRARPGSLLSYSRHLQARKLHRCNSPLRSFSLDAMRNNRPQKPRKINRTKIGKKWKRKEKNPTFRVIARFTVRSAGKVDSTFSAALRGSLDERLTTIIRWISPNR